MCVEVLVHLPPYRAFFKDIAEEAKMRSHRWAQIQSAWFGLNKRKFGCRQIQWEECHSQPKGKQSGRKPR